MPERAPVDGTILRQFVARPREVGAIRRSSPALGAAMARAVHWPEDAAVIEAGPGDGGITESLLAEKPEAAPFVAVELNPACAAALSRRLPGVRVVLDDLANLPAICAREGIGPPGVVVATLPWSLLAPERQQTLLQAILAALAPGGQLLFYIYLQALPFWRRSAFAKLLETRFGIIEHGRIIWRNLPPAVVFDCRGLRPATQPARIRPDPRQRGPR